MFETLEKRLRKNLILWLVVFSIISIPMFLLAYGKSPFVKYVLKGPGSVIDIYPGEELSKYVNKRVRCTITYVGNGVINFYDNADPDQVIYACGYVATDSKMRKPFCVFVPPTQKEQMDALQIKSWELWSGESNEMLADMITVEGYVRKNNGKIYDLYVKALKELYGEQYIVANDVMYYIDGEGSVTKEENTYVKWFMIIYFSYIIIVYTVSILYASGWKKRIYKFISRNSVSELQLESEFAGAEEVIPNLWISQQYTYYLKNLSNTIIKNEDIEQIHLVKYYCRGVSYRFVLTTTGKKQYKSDILTEGNAQKVRQYFQTNLPNIKIGDEKVRYQ